MRVDTLPGPGHYVAGQVRAAAAKRRVNQVTIAKALGMSQQALSRRFVGDLPFDIQELYGIAKLLTVDITELLPSGADADKCMNSLALTFAAA